MEPTYRQLMQLADAYANATANHSPNGLAERDALRDALWKLFQTSD